MTGNIPNGNPEDGKKEESDIWKDPDFLELHFASEENRENITIEPTPAEEEEIIEVPDTQDPELAHELYHKTLQPLLAKRLKGMHPKARKQIRQQVNLLLKDGHERGRDGKQGYYYRMEQAIEIIGIWDRNYPSGMEPATPTRTFALFSLFKDKVDTVLAEHEGRG